MSVMQTPTNFTYKKVFYSIRGLLSAELAAKQQMPALKITELFQQITPNDPLRQWGEDYLEIKQQQREKALLSELEQQAVTRLLTNKIADLTAHEPNKGPHAVALQRYLTDYSFQLKQHYYG